MLLAFARADRLHRRRCLARVASCRASRVKTKSDALAADVLHFASDIVGSCDCACSASIAARFGFTQGDTIAAHRASPSISRSPAIGSRDARSIRSSMPRRKASPTSVRAAALAVPGVIAVENLRLRPVGANVLGDIAISVPRTLSQDEVTAIKGNVSAAIAATQPDVELTVETTPVALDDETRDGAAAAHRGASGISPFITSSSSRSRARSRSPATSRSTARMPLGQAHSIASGLEAEARKEFGPDVEIDTHIEPLEPRELAGEDAPEDIRDAIAEALAAAATDGIHDVHDVRVRETAAGLVVNYHCRADPRTSVAEVHRAVDKMEHEVREAVSRDFAPRRPCRTAALRPHVPFAFAQPAVRGSVLVPVPFRLQRQFRPQPAGDARPVSPRPRECRRADHARHRDFHPAVGVSLRPRGRTRGRA